jgi:hypothetical protein
MAFKRRLTLMGAAMALFLALYGTSRHYSAALVAYVVEQTLLQKLPADADPDRVRERFHELIALQADRRTRLEKLLFLSQYLEKIQRLTSRELEELLRKDARSSNPARLPEYRELLAWPVV